jgi:predicted transcriptional regulator
MRITAAESQVMEALWSKGPLTTDEIIAEVGEDQGWGEATVRTLIHRLLRKKAVAGRRAEGRYDYIPQIQRSDYVHDESQGLLDRLFGGQLTPLVAHFAEHRKITPEEAEKLKALIDNLKDGPAK